MKQSLVILVLAILIGIGGGVYYTRSARPTPQVIPNSIGSATAAPSSSSSLVLGAQSTPADTVSVPTKLIIPAIGINASVESVGLDSEGRMDVPKQPFDVGWYDLGVEPGQKGNAVIGGHLDLATGAPAVFWNLKNLSVGDTISIEDKNGHTFTYKVIKNVNYPWNSFPLQEVFGASGQYNLNLITCSGVWDRYTHNYSTRTVIYSALVQ